MIALNKTKTISGTLIIALSIFSACKKDRTETIQTKGITIENVLDSKPLVQSGTFKGEGTPPVIFPGQSVIIRFAAAKGQALSFATMYGWSNDLFFAPENPGISLYKTDGTPIEGDVSSKIKLWDNGTRINQKPGMSVNHPGVAESSTKNITEVNGTDAQGNTYLPASQLIKATLAYEGNSYFTLTLKNNSKGTDNETPLSPGVWAISYIAGENLLNPAPLFTNNQPTANGLTAIAEMGDNMPLSTYLSGITGIFTPLSPVLVVVYNGIENPIYKVGEADRGQGLKELAQKGNADVLAANLKSKAGVKAVYILEEPTSKVLLPMVNGKAGGKVSKQLSVANGDRIAIATMYGFSNDWFFASSGNGVDATISGDITSNITLYDNGTALNQYPGAGITQFNLAGTPLTENKLIEAVPNPNAFTTLPQINKMIKVTIN